MTPETVAKGAVAGTEAPVKDVAAKVVVRTVKTAKVDRAMAEARLVLKANLSAKVDRPASAASATSTAKHVHPKAAAVAVDAVTVHLAMPTACPHPSLRHPWHPWTKRWPRPMRPPPRPVHPEVNAAKEEARVVVKVVGIGEVVANVDPAM